MAEQQAIFKRAELLLGDQAMDQIARQRVILFGVGGVGSWCAEALVRSGIRQLTIVDSDRVSITNINRQLMATTTTVGQVKVEAMKERLLTINPSADITALQKVFSQETAETSYETLRDKLMEEAKRTFRPELLNRFDETVVFRKLGKEDVVTILDLELAKLRTRLSEKDMTLELDKKAVDFLVTKGSDDAMGARPLRRAVQHHVEDPLADLLLRGTLVPGRIKVSTDKDADALVFKQPKRSAPSSDK
jgi:hypothetical protein